VIRNRQAIEVPGILGLEEGPSGEDNGKKQNAGSSLPTKS
jgi:hypothetical protein